MMPGKKPAGLMMAIGLGKPKKSEEPSEPTMEDEDDDSSEDFDSAAESAFDAVKSGDVDAFKAALKLAVMSCKDY